MKKRFRNLTKIEQEKIELDYHQMDPAEFDRQMAMAKKHVATSIRLSSKMIEALKVVAELEGEREYQSMVRKWIAERLRQEAMVALRLSKVPAKEVAAILRRQIKKR